MLDTTIICLGDSFTRGFGVKNSENWISQTNVTNVILKNAGINGDTTSGMLARFSRDVIDQKPDCVLITGCINDFIVGNGLDIPKNNYMAMAHHAVANQITPIIGIAPGLAINRIRSDWAAFGDFKTVTNNHLALRLWLHSFAATFHFPIFDFYASFETYKTRHKLLPPDRLYLDGVHLTPAGHKAIADSAAAMISKFFDTNTP